MRDESNETERRRQAKREARRRYWQKLKTEPVRYEAFKARHRKSQLRYIAAHPEKVAAGVQAWKDANPDKVKAAAAKWAARNPERAKAIRKAVRDRYRKKHADKLKEYMKAYHREYSKRRREDPEYREQEKARALERYRKQQAAKKVAAEGQE